mmetsp:Transcript_10918/g.30888  ORF Transcript_10918/g.30888 Transcript_10918/m.30888 type:complete len:279 (-) Transcript_10918:1430-2266(-)
MVGASLQSESMTSSSRCQSGIGVGHPRGVQPSTNRIFSDSYDSRREGLGRWSVLDDSLVLQILELVDYRDLGALAAVSHVFYCFANHDDLWKALVIEGMGTSGFDFSASWKETFLRGTEPSCKAADRRPLKASGVFSDLLYQPWFLGHLEIDEEWLRADTIQRRGNLPLEDFRREFELPNVPVVLTGAAAHWPAIKKWTDEYLEEAFHGKPVLAGEYAMSFPQFVKYSQDTSDEMPLYLFGAQQPTLTPPLPARQSDTSLAALDGHVHGAATASASAN